MHHIAHGHTHMRLLAAVVFFVWRSGDFFLRARELSHIEIHVETKRKKNNEIAFFLFFVLLSSSSPASASFPFFSLFDVFVVYDSRPNESFIPRTYYKQHTHTHTHTKYISFI